MDRLIRELESLRQKAQLTNNEVVGVMLAATARFRDILDERMVGIQALASAMAMQPEVDAVKLHDDFLAAVTSHFESLRAVPHDVRDIASAIELAAAERR